MYNEMLDKAGVEYRQDKIKVSEVSIGQQSQIRVGEIYDREQASIYAQAMKKGDEFPPVIVWSKTGKPNYQVIDGNHRLAAARINQTEFISALIVKDPTPAQLTSLVFTTNGSHGKPLTINDRVTWALKLMNDYKYTIRKAAEAARINERALDDRIMTYRAQERCQHLGIRAPISDMRMKFFMRIGSDDVFKRAVVLLGHLSGAEIQTIVRELNELPTDGQRLAWLDSREASMNAVKASSASILKGDEYATIHTAVTKLGRLVRKIDEPASIASMPEEPREIIINQLVAQRDAISALIQKLR
jgi:hypothetical protein